MARTRQHKSRAPTEKPAQTWTRPKKWWKKGDRFTVEYIERAISVKVDENPWTWIYVTKWYLYSRRENTMESANTFADCEYPILERFWGSVGKAIPEGCVEPEPQPTNGGYEIFESTQAYRRREARLTLKMDREDEAGGEESDEPTETVEPVGQELESNTEGEALLMIGSMSNLAIDGETMPLPSSIDHDILFLPVHDSSTSSYSTESETSSVYEPEVAPPAMPPRTMHVKHPEKGRSSLPINMTVAPLDTIRTNASNKPTNFFRTGRGFKPPRLPSAPKYASLRPGNQAAGTLSIFTGGDFRSTPSISLHDRNTMPFRRETGPSREARRTSMTRPQRMQFYNEVYTKEINKTLRKQLAELPPGMERAAWDAGAASSQAEEDALFDEFVAPEPEMRTLQDFPIQELGPMSLSNDCFCLHLIPRSIFEHSQPSGQLCHM